MKTTTARTPSRARARQRSLSTRPTRTLLPGRLRRSLGRLLPSSSSKGRRGRRLLPEEVCNVCEEREHGEDRRWRGNGTHA